MGKYNATFKYKAYHEACQNINGFWVGSDTDTWITGSYCYVEKHIPAKELKGVDGILLVYTYEIFLAKEFKVPFNIGAELLLNINGRQEQVTITGIDDTGKKHVILWA